MSINEGLPHIDDIKGKGKDFRDPVEQFGNFQEILSERFSGQIEELEIEPTEDEKSIIDAATLALPEFLRRRYEVEVERKIGKEKIHTLKTMIEERGKEVSGFLETSTGNIAVVSSDNLHSKIAFASVLAHELIHLYSFRRKLVKREIGKEDKEIFSIYSNREGLSWEPEDKKTFFVIFDEAVSEMLSAVLVEELIENVECLKEEKGNVSYIKDWIIANSKKFGEEENIIIHAANFSQSLPDASQISAFLRSDVDDMEKVSYIKDQILKEEVMSRHVIGYFQAVNWLNYILRETYSRHLSLPYDSPEVFRQAVQFLRKLIKLKFGGRGYTSILREAMEKLGIDNLRELVDKFGSLDPKSGDELPLLEDIIGP